MMMPRYLAPALVVIMLSSLGSAFAETAVAQGLAQSLLADLQAAQCALDRNQSPWPDRASRPQPEPVAALSAELPGNCIWQAFRPVDLAIRQAYRAQRSQYLEKDAGIIQRRTARTGLDPLRDAIKQERACYGNRTIGLALRQVDQVDNALRHLEYYSALCIMWSMADILGLWDRQAALESAGDHLRSARNGALRRQNLSSSHARALKSRLATISTMIETAINWQPAPEGIGPCGDLASSGAPDNHHWATHYDPGGAFGPWREPHQFEETGASPWLLVQPWTRDALDQPAPETRCLAPCPKKYRDWQYKLADPRYGWLVYTHTAASQWRVDCDWRSLEPRATWPGAKGIQNAGGL
ncbi:MAG: hypothetical protein ABFD94_02190 [Armatimonadia bacterium]